MNAIDKLESIINDPSTPDYIREDAKIQLDEQKRLASVGSAQLQVAAATGTGDADILAAFAAIEKAIKSGGSNVSADEIRKAVIEELEKRKITENDLSPSLLAWLNSTRMVKFSTAKLMGVNVTNVKSSTLERPLTQLILSDIMARNNTYLYGGAGTGKTYIAEEIAEMLNWKRITLNCNQFTSPLDILGGQTIQGYQEGKLSIAWSNEYQRDDGTIEKYDGCVLILDELPKIDPNTAGILNEALAKVKDFKKNDSTDTWIAPTILNGKNKVLSLGNLYVIATGNVPLNTIDPDYEANFKQDLSLQDRFIGSTYRVFVDYKYEFETVMKGFAFIWIFLVKLREAITEIRATSQAFVSLRLMINAKATYITYREVESKLPQNTSQSVNLAAKTNSAITKPKTLIQTMDTFFGLFKDSQVNILKEKVDYEGFKKILAEKELMVYNPDNPDFDTKEEKEKGREMIKEYQKKQKQI